MTGEYNFAISWLNEVVGMIAIEIENVRKLPRNEKLQMMETLWEDLSHSEEEMESPDWHRNALEETEQRNETPLDWSEAKKQLPNDWRCHCRLAGA